MIESKTDTKDTMKTAKETTTKPRSTKKSKLVDSIKDVEKDVEKDILNTEYDHVRLEEEKKFDIYNDPYIETPWDIIGSYFKSQHLERLVRHQLESYNNFVSYQIIKTIEMFNPVHIASDQDFDVKSGKHALELFVTFENFHIYRPQIHENNGAIKLMFPQEARLRNFTYASSMTIDINIKYVVRTGENLENMQTFYKVLPKIHIGKLPIMLKSNICVLNQYKHVEHVHTGECKFDAGGYFIINGSEKTVLGQERAAENRVYCFNISKNNTKYTWMAEIKSVPDFKCISPKQINMMVSSKNNGFGYPVCIQIPRIKQPIALFVVFRAMGIVTDKEICEKILLDINQECYKEMLDFLKASIIDANKYLTQQDAIRHIMSYAMYTPINMDKETGAKKKYEFTLDILNNDLFPHCHNNDQKVYYLGYMTHRLMQAHFEVIKGDDRDSYINKRVDTTGILLNNLFRNYFNKLVKDMEKQIIREINGGSWKSTDDYENIVNMTNIYKIIKSTTIENGIKRALATGDFGIKHTNSNKVGVAQVLNRLTYVSSLSHARRISTPTDKSGKLIPPRKLHNTSWGFTCVSETPEGQSVGIVKNLSYMAHITIHSNSLPLYEYVMPSVKNIQELQAVDMYNKVKVFINGAWVGITEEPYELYCMLKEKKYKGIINIYTSIVFDYKMKEIRVCNDAGRLMRPLLRVAKDNSLLLDYDTIDGLKTGNLTWDSLFTDCQIKSSVLEYIDAEEQSFSLIAMTPKDLKLAKENTNDIYKYTHCEIHPSTIFGIMASCIPFPEHNQSPRNCYQCAQGKQAMGVYVSNYENRMDKTAYVLNYPTRPLVDTRIMNLIQLNEIPSGTNVIVAIMTHTGYNQEDSLLFNKASLDRGLFVATIFHTEKDEDKQKINGDEEIRCKPDPTKTKGMKFGNYNKVNNKGVIPENTLVENRDIIIAKVTPIKENRNDHTKLIKYEDQSRIYRNMEETYVDKNYIDRNGDGYNFAKVRLRTVRKPVIGDKFCALPTQQVLTDQGWMEIQDVDIRQHKLATLDTNGNLCYEYPSAKYEYDHEGDMYSLKNNQVQVVCTLNHRLYVKKRSGNKGYELIEAKDVMGKMVRFQKSMTNAYPDVAFMELSEDEKYPMDDWLRLLGMFIADGYAHNGGIYITALKERKIEFNKETMKNLELEYSYSNDGKFIIRATKYRTIYNELELLSKRALHKHLPNYIWNLSQRQSRILLEALLQGDGSSMEYKGETFNRYGTISMQLANDVTRLATHCGYSGIVKISEEPTGVARIGKRNLGSRAGETVEITQKHTYYKVSIITKQNQPWINKKVNDANEEKLITYSGKIYCVEMPSSHTYYSRENNFAPSIVIGNSSRHGQKGTIGNIIPEEDMPFTASGVKPDIIINPHAIPSRMTIGQLKETVLGKTLISLGLFGDGTSFGDFEVKDICQELQKVGFESNGNEIMYNGLTGEQFESSVFIGPVFYQRLKHMVNDKTHSRSIGPMVNLTRQPAEGRSRDGGLRFGEMERDCMVSHGAARFTRGRMYDASDKYSVHVCKKCGLIASYNDVLHIHQCRTCDNRTDFSYVEIPYACKLLFQELGTMNVVPRILTESS
jgi:DNA-directed RNA polymerase II subunit RPB2